MSNIYIQIGSGMLFLHICISKLCVLSLALVLFMVVLVPFLAYYAAKDLHTRDILKTGWCAITAATVVGWFVVFFLL